ncbi:hypothetical protein AB0O01_16445 [Streptomyces sp. NPDC093252]|uniref:hypothetical protein n=1 Tax=Streptomyces sp. NPDC093252 TaxID=3154980 RepID=UPI00343AE373
MTERPTTAEEEPRCTGNSPSDSHLWSGLLMLLVWSSVFAFVMAVVLAHGR